MVGRALPNFSGTFSTDIDQSCSTACAGSNYFGTQSSATGSNTGDCFCGDALALVNGGAVVNTLCGTCPSGPGVCGRRQTTIAIYARAF